MDFFTDIVFDYIRTHPNHLWIIVIAIALPLCELLVTTTFGKVLKAIQDKNFVGTLVTFVCVVATVRLLYFATDYMDKIIKPELNNWVREIAMSRVIDKMKPIYDKVDIGDVVSKATKLPFSFESMYNILIWLVIPMVVTMIVVFVYVLRVDVPMAFTLLLIPAVYLSIALFWLPTRCTDVSRARDRNWNQFMSFADDLLRNLCSVFTEGTKDEEMKGVIKLNTAYTELYQATINCFLGTHFVSFAVSMVVLLVFLFRSKSLIERGVVDVAKFATLALVVMLVVKKTLVSTYYVKELTMQCGIIKESYEMFRGGKEAVQQGNGGAIGPSVGSEEEGIRLNNVTYAYEGTKVPVLQGMEAFYPRRELNVIKGSNGRGKSTILKVILNHCVPQSGTVYIDGEEGGSKEVLRRIGYMPQNIMLFNRSIYENIVYGQKKNAVTPVKLVKTVISELGLDGYLPDIESMVEKSGGNLSGGQKQLVMFLRLLMNDEKDVWLLDEPTSALDERASGIVITVLKSMVGRKTVVVVTHDEV